MKAVYFCALWSGEGDDGWTNTCPRPAALLARALLRSLDSLICAPLGDPPRLFQRQVPPASPADTRFLPKSWHRLPCPLSPSAEMHIRSGSECLAKTPRQQIHHVLWSAAEDASPRLCWCVREVEKVTTFPHSWKNDSEKKTTTLRPIFLLARPILSAILARPQSNSLISDHKQIHAIPPHQFEHLCLTISTLCQLPLFSVSSANRQRKREVSWPIVSIGFDLILLTTGLNRKLQSVWVSFTWGKQSQSRSGNTPAVMGDNSKRTLTNSFFKYKNV